MKTISGKPYIVESILSSTGSGGRPLIEDYLKNALRLRDGDFDIEADLSVKAYKNVLIINKDKIPCWFSCVPNMYVSECSIETFKLPLKAQAITIEKCKDLKSITANDGSEIELLTLAGLPHVDLSHLTNVKIKKLKIKNCGITTLKGLEHVERILSVERCNKLKAYDLRTDEHPVIRIENCMIKSFDEPVSSPDFSLINNQKTTELTIRTGQIETMKVAECDDLKSLYVGEDPVSTFVVSDCKNLVSVVVPDCRISASFVDLPEITHYKLPKITGVCVFENVKTTPEVQCKRIIKR